MKNTLFAKLLVMLLCLCLVLCGCGDAGKTDNDSKNDGNTVVGTDDNGGKENNNTDKEDTVSSPEKIADAALGKTLAAIFANDLGQEDLEGDLDYGKLTLSVGEYVNNELYVNSKDVVLVDELTLNIDGVELEAGVYLSDESLVLTLPEYLDGAYGINLTTLAEDMEGSALWDLLDVDYEEMMSQLGAALDEMSGILENMESSTSDFEKVLEKVTKNINQKITEGKVTVGDQEVDAVIVTYTLDQDGILNIIETVGDGLVEYMEQITEAVGEESVTDDLVDSLDELTAMLAEAEVNAELVTNINAETGYIMTVSGVVEMTVEGETAAVTMDIDLGVNAAENDKYTLKVGTIAEGEMIDVCLLVLNREITDSKLTYTLSAKAAGVEIGSAEFSYNKKSSEYMIAVEIEDGTFSVTGSYKTSKDAVEFTVDTIDVDGEEMEIGAKLTLEAVSANEIPNVPKYTNVFTMTEDELLEVVGELGESFGSVSYDEDLEDNWSDYEDDWSDYEDDWSEDYDDLYDDNF